MTKIALILTISQIQILKISSQFPNKECGRPQLSNQPLPQLSTSTSNPTPISTEPIATSQVTSQTQLPTLLIDAFQSRATDTKEFSPILDAGHIRHSVVRYKSYVECCTNNIKGV